MLRLPLLSIALLAGCSAAEPAAFAADSDALADIAPAAKTYGEVLSTVSENVGWQRFNMDQFLEWGRPGGDWVDAAGTPWGDRPFATVGLSKGSENSWISLDVTDAMRGHDGALFLRKGTGGKTFKMHSDEAKDPALRPYLLIEGPAGERRVPVEVAHLASSTSKSLGERPFVATAGGIIALTGDVALEDGERATINFHTMRGFGRQELAVYRAAPMPAPPPVADVAPAKRTLVNIEPGDWAEDVARRDIARTRKPNGGRGVTPLADGTLRIKWPGTGGVASAMSSRLEIPVEDRGPLTVLAYTIMVGDDFTPTMTGKFPGLVNTGHIDPDHIKRRYGGFGGRPALNGVWTARIFQGSARGGPFADEFSPIDTYVYTNGDRDLNGVLYGLTRPLPRREWVTLVQAVDTERGMLAHWVVTEHGAHQIGMTTGLVFYTDEDVAKFGVEYCYTSEAWLNFHIGGTGFEKRTHDGHTIWLESARIYDGLPDLDAEVARLRDVNAASRQRIVS
ncbi:MAG: hypothetical protein AAF205_12655 [Pseudomonadota bacterium]